MCVIWKKILFSTLIHGTVLSNFVVFYGMPFFSMYKYIFARKIRLI